MSISISCPFSSFLGFVVTIAANLGAATENRLCGGTGLNACTGLLRSGFPERTPASLRCMTVVMFVEDGSRGTGGGADQCSLRYLRWLLRHKERLNSVRIMLERILAAAGVVITAIWLRLKEQHLRGQAPNVKISVSAIRRPFLRQGPHPRFRHRTCA